MKYKDIFSEAVSYFTDIPKDFVLSYFEKYEISNKNKEKLFRYVMDIDFPEREGNILLDDLKSKGLYETIGFFNRSFKLIKDETVRQASLN